MFGNKKQTLLVWSVILSNLIFTACTSEPTEIKGFELTGNAQGTTYTIIVAEEKIDFSKEDIDNILSDFDTILSTYNVESQLSQLNNSSKEFAFADPAHYFKNCYELSHEVFVTSNGAFDPSVFPLVKGWGFFKKMETPLDPQSIDSLLQFISFEKDKLHSVKFANDSVYFSKKDPRFMLDFNAIAQGYSIDVLADFLEKKGCENYYIELGGELRVKGKNRSSEDWKIGIDTPKELNAGNGERSISGILSITDKSIATSGNYRNFYEVEGKKFSHTLNPITGYPVQHNLLSATVIADDCGTADAFATVFMVVGLEEAKKILAMKKNNLEAVLIYQRKDGNLGFYVSPGAKSYFSE